MKAATSGLDISMAAAVERIAKAKAELVAVQKAIGRSAELADLLVGPALDHLNAAFESLCRCERVATIRWRDPHRGAGT